MPMDDAGIEAAVADDSAKAADARQQAIGMTVPLADEPLKASVVNSLAQLVAPAIDRLTNGEMPAPEIPPVDGDVDQVPASIAGPVLAIGGLIKQYAAQLPELKAYEFDPMAMLTTNDGLTEVGMLIDDLSNDPAVLKAITAGAPPGAPPADEEADTDTDTEIE